jgi:putative protein-disulfide isomerase
MRSPSILQRGMTDVDYLTDPTDPWSWALEPARLRLERDFGAALVLRYVMAGASREFAATPAIAREWLEASAQSGMPVDVRLWLADAPRSSYPACMAVCAAAEQGAAERLLRRLREGFAVGARRMDTADALIAEARGAGLDAERFRIDLGSHAILERFDADLQRARRHLDGAAGLPAFVFRSEDGSERVLRDVRGYERLREAALAAGARAVDSTPPLTVEAALERHGALAGAEIAALCDLPGPRAPAALWRAASEWRVRAVGAPGAELWELA